MDINKQLSTVNYLSVIAFNENKTHILLVEKKTAPGQLQANPGLDKTYWGLPGGLVEEEETIEATAQRKLSQETGLDLIEVKDEPYKTSKYVRHLDSLRETSVVICEVEGGKKPLPNDPNRQILNADWVERTEAMQRLEKNPYTDYVEPFAHFMLHGKIVQKWMYEKKTRDSMPERIAPVYTPQFFG